MDFEQSLLSHRLWESAFIGAVNDPPELLDRKNLTDLLWPRSATLCWLSGWCAQTCSPAAGFIVQTGQSEHLRFTTVWQHRQQHAHSLNVTSAHTARADEVQTWPAVIQLTASFLLPNTFLLFALTVSRLHAASLPPGARVKAFLSERCRAAGWMGGWSIGSKSSKNRSKVSAFV